MYGLSPTSARHNALSISTRSYPHSNSDERSMSDKPISPTSTFYSEKQSYSHPNDTPPRVAPRKNSNPWSRPFTAGASAILGATTSKPGSDGLPGRGTYRAKRGTGRSAWSKKQRAAGVFALVCLLLPLVWFFKLRKVTTLSVSRGEIERIWRWEIASGRFPSYRKIGITFTNQVAPEVGIPVARGDQGQVPIGIPVIHEEDSVVVFDNPALPSWGNGRERGGKVRAMIEGKIETQLVGSGQERSYLEIKPRIGSTTWGRMELSSYPKRPIVNSVLDLDAVMDHCDFSDGHYVRDCLEGLRLNAGLDSGVRRGDTRGFEMTFVLLNDQIRVLSHLPTTALDLPSILASPDFPNLEAAQYQHTLSLPSLYNPSLQHTPHSTHPTADPYCNPTQPRIFHLFWAGPFTDKPYAAALSFLFTQKLQLNLKSTNKVPFVCRPQLWIWINPGTAASSLSSSGSILEEEEAERKMMAELEQNPWSAPFLHERFRESIKFRLWNTTEQLDSVVEMKGWRDMKLFSGQVKFGEKLNSTKSQRVGSTSSSSYDRLSCDLSDMARFLLVHRYGGIYLDADTLLLRDWEELFNYRGAFAYRWSRLQTYNTAVLRMGRGSMLGSFVIRMAMKNGGDFHPMHVGNYLKDAGLEGLLLRLPDALFDSAWLNVEDYQRDRPAFPLFHSFNDFFNASTSTAAPNSLGFDGFFRGAFSYHFHNYWWIPFDPSRNYPDLGIRFLGGERIARANLLIKKQLALKSSPIPQTPASSFSVDGSEEREETDLSWSSVLKRTFESFVRGDRGNMYGEFITWD